MEYLEITLQSYEKTSKEPNLFEFFRVLSKFGEANVTEKTSKEPNLELFFH